MRAFFDRDLVPDQGRAFFSYLSGDGPTPACGPRGAVPHLLRRRYYLGSSARGPLAKIQNNGRSLTHRPDIGAARGAGLCPDCRDVLTTFSLMPLARKVTSQPKRRHSVHSPPRRDAAEGRGLYP